MSSPLAKPRKSILDRAMVAAHQGISHSHRVHQVSHRIVQLLNARFGDAKSLRLLDIGCGDLSIAESVSRLRPSTEIIGIDLYPLPESWQREPRWKRYRQFDGKSIPFPGNEFSVASLCDVLHHAETGDQVALIEEAMRVAPLVIVKDHFEEGLFSRQVLKAMDFVGNYGYGVSVPNRYFNLSSFQELIRGSGGTITDLHRGLELYSHLPFGNLILRPEWQFIAEVTKAT